VLDAGMTSTAAVSDLRQVLGGLDLLECPEAAFPDQDQLAEALVHQSQAQGLAIQAREAQLAARLLLTLRKGHDFSGMADTDGRLLSDKALKALLSWPELTLTAEEETAQARSRRDPSRWGAGLMASGVLAVMTGAVGWASYGLGKLSQYLSTSGWSDPVALVSFFFLMITICLGLATFFGLGETFFGSDLSLFHARRKAVYQAQLQPLSLIQLVQVQTALKTQEMPSKERIAIVQELLEARQIVPTEVTS
jgi:hypothetical protein